jgi:hypothetical protein
MKLLISLLFLLFSNLENDKEIVIKSCYDL